MFAEYLGQLVWKQKSLPPLGDPGYTYEPSARAQAPIQYHELLKALAKLKTKKSAGTG